MEKGKMLSRVSSLALLLVAGATVASADYILDAPKGAPTPPPPPGSGGGNGKFSADSWKFDDIDADEAGTQINAWIEVDGGTVKFLTDSTVDANGKAAGIQTFSIFKGATVLAAFELNGILFAKVQNEDGSTTFVTPGYNEGNTADAEVLNPSTDASVTLKLGKSKGAKGWTYVDEDKNTAGVQVNTWADFDPETGRFAFFTNSTNKGTKQVNGFKRNGINLTGLSEVISYKGLIFAFGTAKLKNGQVSNVVLTPNYSPTRDATLILPDGF